jgi:hypothetical protein
VDNDDVCSFWLDVRQRRCDRHRFNEEGGRMEGTVGYMFLILRQKRESIDSIAFLVFRYIITLSQSHTFI